MKILKTHKRVEIDKRIGNMRITSIHYAEPKKDKWDNYTIVSVWYDRDCENCPCVWDQMSYEGECDDCGCVLNYDFDVPTWKCMLPKWLKRRIKKRYDKKYTY